MRNDFSARLKYFRSLKDLSQAELAKRVGISGKQVSDYEVGTSKPRQSTYLKILNALDVTDDEFRSQDLVNQSNLPVIFRIPLFSWMDIANSNLDLTKSDSYLYVDSNILRRTSASGLFAMQINGLSMYPQYKEGDFIIADSTLKNIKDGFTYILSTGEEATIKQCFKKPNGNIHLSTYNPSFPSFEVEPLTILITGEVVFKMGAV